jgi:hypothetical protein
MAVRENIAMLIVSIAKTLIVMERSKLFREDGTDGDEPVSSLVVVVFYLDAGRVEPS